MLYSSKQARSSYSLSTIAVEMHTWTTVYKEHQDKLETTIFTLLFRWPTQSLQQVKVTNEDLIAVGINEYDNEFCK